MKPTSHTSRHSASSFDPLNAGLAPPANESEEERAARLEAAREATRVSRAIDAGLAETKRAMERKKRAVKILLLGQSESGKSSVLRNFRLAFTPKYFESERLVWKTVIQLNLISSIKKILTVLQDEWDSCPTSPASNSASTSKNNSTANSPIEGPSSYAYHPSSSGHGHDSPPATSSPTRSPVLGAQGTLPPSSFAAGAGADAGGSESGHASGSGAGGSNIGGNGNGGGTSNGNGLTSTHRRLALSLSPLLAFETSISQVIAAEGLNSSGSSPNNPGGGYTVTVRPGGGWKDRLASFAGVKHHTHGEGEVEAMGGMKAAHILTSGASTISAGSVGSVGSVGSTGSVLSTASAASELTTTPANANVETNTDEPQTPTQTQEHPDPSQVTTVLAACRAEIAALWGDPAVRRCLEGRGVYLRDEGGFFLDDTARIAALDYVPTDRDIIRARIRTLGVEEHRFVTESGFRAGTEFYITDVCGSSSQRSTWVPYFDDVQAILFLAPLAFWQSLDEDSKVNRVQDSLEIWREIVGNPLLAKTAFILLFNKKDILQAHIAAGVQVKKFVPSFGDRPNDVQSVTKYFRDKFSAYHRKFSPEPRPFIFYETEAIDTKSTAAILGEVQEQIIRNHLKDLDVIYSGQR
ncbi:G-alpha-domain-containing protein [Mycena polygramma]|nr:G-alpha-domain-containing protein [Mycena polygramma]